MTLSHEERAAELGLVIPDYASVPYHGLSYGSMKAFHKTGNLLFLSGHVEDAPGHEGDPLHAGRLGAEVTVEQGYEAARLTALNCLATIRLALGTLDRVKGLVGSLNYVAVAPGFTDVHLISSGATDLFRDLFGPENGLGGRATLGVSALAGNHCFENVLTIETVD
ncbi:RidA family protein [Herbiconiux sp. KACC 21604]|uniref:RidA family protein n=1 Tax=unclassified Herbiconiux TaxID=2618217 RepID=UPI001492CD88|nr:RidA family protein [Herbiconiux sp. SALV-R1]QJU55180.1 RidA family protein [Herbiconiux sp. SALV-R1]WPO86341.1 RidA family protein [Herbiconiux sp. KACC 21604]